jgi:hypothetical protein
VLVNKDLCALFNGAELHPAAGFLLQILFAPYAAAGTGNTVSKMPADRFA